MMIIREPLIKSQERSAAARAKRGRIKKRKHPRCFLSCHALTGLVTGSAHIQTLKDQSRLNPVAAAEALTAAVGGRHRMQTVSLGDLLVDHSFKIGKVPRAGSKELFLQRYLQHHIGQRIP